MKPALTGVQRPTPIAVFVTHNLDFDVFARNKWFLGLIMNISMASLMICF